MSETSYFSLIIGDLSSSLEELLTFELFENGASGVQENLQFQQVDRQYLPEVIEQENKSIVAYFEQSPNPDWLQSLVQRYPQLNFQLEQEPLKDWLEEWKKQWQPFELIPNVWVVPSWHESQHFDGRKIGIDPGMAFGTGTHETTQIASQLLADLLGDQNILTAMDVGTGSGVLSFLAAHLGCKDCYLYDNDPESKRVVYENHQRNSYANIHWVENWSSQLAGQIDLVIANIIDGVLLNLKSEFQKLQSPYYLFTGILQEREEDFLAEMLQDWPLKSIKRLQKGEWVGFLFKANP